MATRKIKDAKDLSTNELIYFKGHAKATYMSDGRNVEEAIHHIGTGGGGGGITAETDPIFSASPAASITEGKKAEWDDKQDAIADLTTIREGAQKGATALQSYTEQYKGTVTKVKINGSTKSPDSNGVVDLGMIEGGGGSSSGSGGDINWVLLDADVSDHILEPNTHSLLIAETRSNYSFSFNHASPSELRSGKGQEFVLRVQMGGNLHFSGSISFEDYVVWVNGDAPNIERQGVMEFSFIPAGAWGETYLLGTWGSFYCLYMGADDGGPA